MDVKTVLVTGAAGTVGKVVVRHFLERDWNVRGFDRVPAPKSLHGEVDWRLGDMTQRFDLLRATEGVDAVAHLAAIPHPMNGEEGIFATNVAGTQALLDACELNGVPRFALASTGCTFGMIFARHPFPPSYLPVDEGHPLLPQDMYGLSKVCGELTCAAYTRRCGMTTSALRLTTVMDFSGLSRQRWLPHRLASEDFQTDLWTYVDVRDVARCFELALTNQEERTHATALLCAQDSFTKQDIRELVKKHLPDLAPQVAHLKPDACLYNLDRAIEAWGFTARHSWRDCPELNV